MQNFHGFVMSFPKTHKGNYSVWKIVDRVTKLANFILIKISYPLQKLPELYVEKVISLHGNPSSVISNRDPRFGSSLFGSL